MRARVLPDDTMFGIVGGLVEGPVASRLLIHHVAPFGTADLRLAGGEQQGGKEYKNQSFHCPETESLYITAQA